MKEWAASFYSGREWKHLREEVQRRDHRLCVDCLKKGLIVPAEEVHHIEELTPENINDESVALNPDNLVCLCRECHKIRHGARKKRYKVDELGRVAVPPGAD